jgi:hypothetical protein
MFDLSTSKIENLLNQHTMDKYDADEEDPDGHFYDSQEDLFTDAKDGIPLSKTNEKKK